MMGYWQRGGPAFAYSTPFYTMDDYANAGSDTEEDEAYHRNWTEELNQNQQPIMPPEDTHAGSLGRSPSFTETGGDGALPGAFFAGNGQSAPDIDYSRRAAAARNGIVSSSVEDPHTTPDVWGVSASFETLHGRQQSPHHLQDATPVSHYEDVHYATTSEYSAGHGSFPPPLDPSEISKLSEQHRGNYPAVRPRPEPTMMNVLSSKEVPMAASTKSSDDDSSYQEETEEEEHHTTMAVSRTSGGSIARKKGPASKRISPKHSRPQRRDSPRRAKAASQKPAGKKDPRAGLSFMDHEEQRGSRLFEPNNGEILNCKTERKLRALHNFYDRINDLKSYKDQFGDCLVPQKYPANPKLGVWVNKMRMEKKKYDRGEEPSSLDRTRIGHLESLQFNWGSNKGDEKWEEHFRDLVRFKAANNHCDVPTKYSINPALGRFVSTQRSEYRKFCNNKRSLIDQEKVDQLNALGFTWDMTQK